MLVTSLWAHFHKWEPPLTSWTTCVWQSNFDWCVFQRNGNRLEHNFVFRVVPRHFIFRMTDRKPILDCDPQDSEIGNVSDTNPAEEEKCCPSGAEESSRMKKTPTIQELEELLYSAPRSCRHCDEVWPRLYLGDMWASSVPFKLIHDVWESCSTCVTRVSGSCLTTRSGCGSWVSPTSWMLHTGSSAVREMRTFMGPQWNTMASLLMTCLPTFDLSPFFYPAAEFIHLALTSDGKTLTQLLADLTLRQHICLHFLSFATFRKGVCALCCWCESLSCAGPGLPDDPSPSQPPVLRTLCATETLDFSQQRLLKTPYQTAPKTPRVNRVKSSNCEK